MRPFIEKQKKRKYLGTNKKLGNVEILLREREEVGPLLPGAPDL